MPTTARAVYQLTLLSAIICVKISSVSHPVKPASLIIATAPVVYRLTFSTAIHVKKSSVPHPVYCASITPQTALAVYQLTFWTVTPIRV